MINIYGSEGGKDIVHVSIWDHAWLAQLPEANAARQGDGSIVDSKSRLKSVIGLMK